MTDLVATLLPSMERMGIVKASEVEPPTLAQRILAEVGAEARLEPVVEYPCTQEIVGLNRFE